MRRAARCAVTAMLVWPVLLTACGSDDEESDTAMANPASVFCEEQGGTVENERDAAGNETGICVLEDGTRVDEWDYYRANSPDAAAVPTEVNAYATAFVEAWERGDRAAAAVFATDEALDAVFARDAGGADVWTLQRCESAAGSSDCRFEAGGDAPLVVRVSNEIASLGGPDGAVEAWFET